MIYEDEFEKFSDIFSYGEVINPKTSALKALRFAIILVRFHGPILPLSLKLTDNQIKIPNNNLRKIILIVKLWKITCTAVNKNRHFYNLYFDSFFYKNYYQDLKDLNYSSWVHYYNFGNNENRRTSPFFDSVYLSNQKIEIDNLSDLRYSALSNITPFTAEYVCLSNFDERTVNTKLLNCKEFTENFINLDLLKLDFKSYPNQFRTVVIHKTIQNYIGNQG